MARRYIFAPNSAFMSHHLIIVGGPTASGKTALAIAIAQYFGTEILSSDSRQFYREMSIGTAKPTPEELAAVKHHFIDSLSVTDDYSVGDFERDALATLQQIFQKNNVAVMAGGSGLFINAVCNGLDKFPEISELTKKAVENGINEGGLPWLQQEVSRLDPVYFGQADQYNPARLRRALEVCLESGLPYSSFLGRQQTERPFQIHYILADWPREELYDRINRRVDMMIAEGLEEEVKRLLPFRDRPALRTVGYEEWFPYFEGKIDQQTVIDKIKQHSRNYAKRQGTWFRKYGHWTSFNPKNSKLILDYLVQSIKKA